MYEIFLEFDTSFEPSIPQALQPVRRVDNIRNASDADLPDAINQHKYYLAGGKKQKKTKEKNLKFQVLIQKSNF